MITAINNQTEWAAGCSKTIIIMNLYYNDSKRFFDENWMGFKGCMGKSRIKKR
jgi:hypothetical protein